MLAEEELMIIAITWETRLNSSKHAVYFKIEDILIESASPSMINLLR